MEGNNITQQIMAIQRDPSLTDVEKAKKRQELLSGKWVQPQESVTESQGAAATVPTQPAMFDDSLKCAMCMDLCARPVTAPCQHNFCLACFKKWVAQGKTCPTCRNPFPAKFAANPRINTALTTAIRMAKQGVREPGNISNFERIRDKDRPDEAFTTARAVRAGRANAASGRIMVTVPNDHFGPIPPEADPRGLGVRVGESWKDRLDCRQWGAHFPHVAGIAGQSNVGAQSVVLSGGYEDDRDEGEWFLYTGSGGRDLSGNKRTNKEQSFDQKFESSNKALLISCQKGLPLRVVRSHKEKRSAYAPTEEEPVRYDGIYRIVRCWRKAGMQKFLVCRYLFVRCDNEPAPWSTEDVGDSAWGAELPADAVHDMKEAKGTIYETADQPWWDWNADKKEWGWARPPPVSQKSGGEPDTPKKLRKKASEQERALREFMCKLCSGVLSEPVSAPCGHHFCRPCLDKHFQGQGEVLNRSARAGRTLRVQKVVKPCPTCKADIADFLANSQVNRDMQVVIEKLQAGAQKAQEVAHKLETPAPSAEGVEALAEEVEHAEAMAEEGLLSAGKGPKPAAAGDAAEEENEQDKAAVRTEAAAGAPCEAVLPDASPSRPAPLSITAQEADLAGLCRDFPDFDRGLIEGMLADQGGDVPEVQACLRRMVKQTAAAQRRAEAEARKAAKAAAGSTAADTGHAACADGLQANLSAGVAASDNATEVKAEAAQANESHLVPAGNTQAAAARGNSAKQSENQDLNRLTSAAAGGEAQAFDEDQQHR
ncbi:MAG: E3 ubiquitin- ligase ORTHRUS 2-like [Trebouxia sp. A1-2]|nr:MAG: E3 ubiquitin- ligase ORTHRUS 2-like [Trebouxia sp. A1-2]